VRGRWEGTAYRRIDVLQQLAHFGYLPQSLVEGRAERSEEETENRCKTFMSNHTLSPQTFLQQLWSA